MLSIGCVIDKDSILAVWLAYSTESYPLLRTPMACLVSTTLCDTVFDTNNTLITNLERPPIKSVNNLTYTYRYQCEELPFLLDCNYGWNSMSD